MPLPLLTEWHKSYVGSINFCLTVYSKFVSKIFIFASTLHNVAIAKALIQDLVHLIPRYHPCSHYTLHWYHQLSKFYCYSFILLWSPACWLGDPQAPDFPTQHLMNSIWLPAALVGTFGMQGHLKYCSPLSSSQTEWSSYFAVSSICPLSDLSRSSICNIGYI